ncbi:hypothetical protein [Lichenibacterium dinghuense]|uniref:hypothetical protein n=1 Tax=Lichenibacterium dinghuense TaxID=2895977 RepID=UPI001F3EAB66|nr:hypothetical protein [Lichenibacterium sp. 6Y81]
MAEMVFTPEARARRERDPVFRDDLHPVMEFLRPHVFSDRAARDAACRSTMPGGVFALEPVGVDGLAFRWPGMCLFAIGHGVGDLGFEDVASAIADPEMIGLVERCAWRGGPNGKHRADSIVLSVSGALYRLLVDEDGMAEVRAKSLFGAVPDDEVAATATWLLERLMGRLDFGPKPVA